MRDNDLKSITGTMKQINDELGPLRRRMEQLEEEMRRMKPLLTKLISLLEDR